MTDIAASRRFRAKPSAVWHVVADVARHPANSKRPARALAHLVGCEVRARFTDGTVVTPLGEHSRLLARLHRGGSWRAVRANPPDFAEMTAWRRQLRPRDLFVDVGAHAGVYSVWALDAGADVVAVEPDPEMVRQLRENLTLNGYDAEVHAVALGAQAGRLQLAGPDLLRRRLVLDGPSADGVEVTVTTLDEVLGPRRARGVKIDVEGAERLVLEGGQQALREQRIDLLQLEWNDCSVELLGEDRGPVAALLADCGYVLGRPDREGKLAATSASGFGSDVFAWPRDRDV